MSAANKDDLNSPQTNKSASATPHETDAGRGPGVRFPPPLVFLSCLIAGAGLGYVFPVSLGVPAVLTWIGLLVVAAGFVILYICWLAFRRARTAIEPWKPTTTMVYSGCYRFSRNPIYLSMCLILFGIGIYANSLWIFLAGFPCGYIIYRVAIKKEEAYLAEQFGESYLNYQKQVRRWI